jgi:hypothetical protein
MPSRDEADPEAASFDSIDLTGEQGRAARRPPLSQCWKGPARAADLSPPRLKASGPSKQDRPPSSGVFKGKGVPEGPVPAAVIPDRFPPTAALGQNYIARAGSVPGFPGEANESNACV